MRNSIIISTLSQFGCDHKRTPTMMSEPRLLVMSRMYCTSESVKVICLNEIFILLLFYHKVNMIIALIGILIQRILRPSESAGLGGWTDDDGDKKDDE